MAQQNTTRNIAAGVGIAALAAAAAGAVFLYGTEAGKKRRKEIKSWTLRMKADVLDAMTDMKEWSEDAYQDVVTSVAEKYKSMQNINPEEVAALVASLRSHWRAIKRQVEGVGSTRKTTKKSSGKKSKTKKKTSGK